MKYFLIIFFTFKICYSQNLSTYFEVSIKNLDPHLNQEYFLDKVIQRLTSSSFSSKDISIYLTNFFYDKSLETYNFQIDLDNLSQKLLLERSKFNLNLLNCSLVDNFFTLNRQEQILGCPSFISISTKYGDYLYIQNQNSHFRIAKIMNNQKEFIKNSWINFLPTSKNFERNYKINSNDYMKLVKVLNYYPKITSYENNYVTTSINHFYTNEEISFILKFL